jgi:hypothetical protein
LEGGDGQQGRMLPEVLLCPLSGTPRSCGVQEVPHCLLGHMWLHIQRHVSAFFDASCYKFTQIMICLPQVSLRLLSNKIGSAGFQFHQLPQL